MKARSHLVLDGTQIGQDDTKAHGHNQNKDARDGLADAAQEDSIQSCDVWPEASGIEVDIVKVPGAHLHHAQGHNSCDPVLQCKDILQV